MAKKKTTKPKEEKKIVTPKIEKITVTEVPLGPTNLELDLRLTIIERRFEELKTAISKSKSVKGI